MTAHLEDKHRQVIPRWRNSTVAAYMGELNPVSLREVNSLVDNDRFREKIETWQSSKTVSSAAEVVGAALVLGRHEEVRAAAKFLKSKSAIASDLVRTIADLVLITPRKPAKDTFPTTIPTSVERREIYPVVHDLKKRLYDEPRNSLIWADVARCYAVLGLKEKAVRAMKNALALSPNNRFILRAATRLHLHYGDAEYAHDLIRRAEPTKYDPWLLGSEIATASVAQRTSRYIKIGKQMIKSPEKIPLSLSELATAIGTLEFEAGNTKNARKLFNRALVDPTENAVAQIGWVSRQGSVVEDFQKHLNIPNSFEARAWNYFQNSKWSQALQESKNWLYDQAFSSRPSIHASYVAILMENWEEGAGIAKYGLYTNPDNPILLNNLVVALVSNGLVDEAENKLKKIDTAGLDNRMRVIVQATEGLVWYRKGFPEKGRALYLQAMDMARRSRYRSLMLRAAIFFSREEILSKSDRALETIDTALKLSRNSKEPDVILMVNRLEKLSKIYS